VREQPGSDKQLSSPWGTSERRVVAQATGVLVSQFGINTEDAFEKIATIACDEELPISDVAARIVEQGGL
jgi:AmiR/NasT family two-component response regulator